MTCTARLLALLLVLPFLARASAEDGDIAWSKDLSTGFAQAKEQQKILMICVNAKYVLGRTEEEPANKGLREVIYKDARVVTRAREFICVLLTPDGSSDEYGELRALGIEGNIVAPQHIFVHPDGKQILLRKEYWSYGKGETGLARLLGMMEQAQKALQGKDEAPEAAPEGDAPDGAPADPAADERAAWIAARVTDIVQGTEQKRDAAIRAMIQNDQEDDCTGPLLALLDQHKQNTGLIVALVRGMGVDGFLVAAPRIADHLTHKHDAVRGNAAVSLEYIGSNEKSVLSDLRKAAGKERIIEIANHMYRALGRCGTGDSKVRSLLLKKAGSAKSEFASYGPTIGLSYFQGDKKAARGVEKLLKKMGVPGSRRGGGQNTVKRGLVSWTLAAIGEPGSAKFMREEMVAKLENVQAFWVAGLRRFWEQVALCCEGDSSGSLEAVAAGVRLIVEFAKGGDLGRYGAETRGLMDEYRLGRNNSAFKPMGDGIMGEALR